MRCKDTKFFQMQGNFKVGSCSVVQLFSWQLGVRNVELGMWSCRFASLTPSNAEHLRGTKQSREQLSVWSCSVVSLEYEVAKAHGHGLYRPSLAGVGVMKLQILLHKLGWRHDFHVCGISITIVAQIDGNERITLGL